MRINLITIFCVLFINNLYSSLIITRSEMDIISRELYYDNMFAEVQNELIVSIWNFNTFELTMIHHPLRIYTTVDFETFKTYQQRQNQAEIDTELRTFDDERRKLMADATSTLYSRMRPNFAVKDTLLLHGFKAREYHVFNGDIVIQKVWISDDLQAKINTIVNPISIKQVESIFKENREKYLEALGIRMDPISRLVESLEEFGYVVQRVNYGLRNTRDIELEAEIESLVNTIIDIAETTIDPLIFTYHHRFKKLDYSAYQIEVIKSMEIFLEQ